MSSCWSNFSISIESEQILVGKEQNSSFLSSSNPRTRCRNYFVSSLLQASHPHKQILVFISFLSFLQVSHGIFLYNFYHIIYQLLPTRDLLYVDIVDDRTESILARVTFTLFFPFLLSSLVIRLS